jgi:hypothetical protein
MFKNIRNEDINSINLDKKNNDKTQDIFIFAIGYEDRSIAIFSKYFSDGSTKKIGLLFSDYKMHKSAQKNREYVLKHSIDPLIIEYDNHQYIFDIVNKEVENARQESDKINIHFDYSSMPRSWYCNFAKNAQKILGLNDRVYFWYSQGKYSRNNAPWPNAGIEDFVLFSGRASLRPENSRSHIFGMGFDSARAHAICSVLDPSYLIVSYSYASGDEKMRKKIERLNNALLNLASSSITLPIDDFKFSFSKLYETVKDLHRDGDVILVPDGPKTQILAASIIPEMFDGFGVVCLHVKRHSSSFSPVNVKATGIIYGFSIGKCID